VFNIYSSLQLRVSAHEMFVNVTMYFVFIAQLSVAVIETLTNDNVFLKLLQLNIFVRV